ncbi:UPF0598 protein CG30010 [Venturia canescens]|uniref:UPF0598 protein CG30010 n=1 Tax=Venturia canescens TaxID=32260 RepID=UPI001C9CD2E6|nr:UPF0598 protein CG30010 [Venturia canescens]
MLSKFRNSVRFSTIHRNYVDYVQGQSPEAKVREYFYFIDHQGMLFLDDARIKNFTSCFKEKKFLAFFFKKLKKNDTGRYDETFPYLSVCGRERNFVRCDDVPIVFTHVLQKEPENWWFSYAHAGDSLMVPFEPEKLYMSIHSGRVYHPASSKVGGAGLVRSNLAIEMSRYFDFENGEEREPTHFNWKGKRHPLDTQWHKHTIIDNKSNKK